MIDPKTTISRNEFNERIKKGDKLVLLDNLVLDVSRYQFSHPGGKFVINQNIGRDISKFFYGGYSMENYNKLKPHTHSNIARWTVDTLIIGKLD